MDRVISKILGLERGPNWKAGRDVKEGATRAAKAEQVWSFRDGGGACRHRSKLSGPKAIIRAACEKAT